MPLRWPFAEASDVMDAFQSFVTFRSHSPLRTLKRQRLISSGIRVAIRDGGKLTGSVRVYSALAMDAARAERRNQGTLARRYAREAARLEGETESLVGSPPAGALSAHRPSRSRVEIHEDVDVATRGGVTAGDGSKEPRIAGSVAPQNLVQLLTASSDGCPGVGRGTGNGHARSIAAKAADHHQRQAGARRSWGRRGWHPRISEPAVGALRALRSPDRRMAFDHAVATRSCNTMFWGHNPALSSSNEFARHSQ